LALFLI